MPDLLGGIAKPLQVWRPLEDAWEGTGALIRGLPSMLAATGILLLPALWNRYPLFYYDSVDYVKMPFVWQMPIYRTAAYGVFSITGRWSHSVWGIVIAQSLIMAYVLFEAVALFAPRARASVLITIAGLLALLTGLPWAASTVMPDALTGTVVLATFILAFEKGALGPWRRGALILILAVATAVHTTHFALVGGLMICFVAVRLLARQARPLLVPRIRAVLLGFVLALGAGAGSNWLMTGKVFLTQPNSVLMLGLLVQDGLAKRYLDQVCVSPGHQPLDLCKVRHRLPDNANQFIWHDPDFILLGGWTGLEQEAAQVVHGSLTRYPFRFAMISLGLTAQQFSTSKTGDGLAPMDYLIGSTIKTYYPREAKTFKHTRQQSGFDLETLNALQMPLQFASVALLFGIAWYGWRKRDAVMATMAPLILLALLGNSFVCGALSNPADRYGSRIIWLGIFFLMVAGLRWLAAREKDTEGDSSAPAMPTIPDAMAGAVPETPSASG